MDNLLLSSEGDTIIANGLTQLVNFWRTGCNYRKL